MSASLVVPLVVSQKSGEAVVLSAFVIAERAEKSKIEGWAQEFEFDLTEPVIIDLGAKQNSDQIVQNVLKTIQETSSHGIVAASKEYLRRAGIYDDLVSALKKANKRVWIADLGSLALDELVSA